VPAVGAYGMFDPHAGETLNPFTTSRQNPCVYLIFVGLTRVSQSKRRAAVLAPLPTTVPPPCTAAGSPAAAVARAPITPHSAQKGIRCDEVPYEDVNQIKVRAVSRPPLPPPRAAPCVARVVANLTRSTRESNTPAYGIYANVR
jgi:hypothetical protein